MYILLLLAWCWLFLPTECKQPVLLEFYPTGNVLMPDSNSTDWNLRTKFVDDTKVSEIIPRNSTNVIDIVAENVNYFVKSNRMKPNPNKFKEMVIDPLEYNITLFGY